MGYLIPFNHGQINAFVVDGFVVHRAACAGVQIIPVASDKGIYTIIVAAWNGSIHEAHIGIFKVNGAVRPNGQLSYICAVEVEGEGQVNGPVVVVVALAKVQPGAADFDPVVGGSARFIAVNEGVTIGIRTASIQDAAQRCWRKAARHFIELEVVGGCHAVGQSDRSCIHGPHIQGDMYR